METTNAVTSEASPKAKPRSRAVRESIEELVERAWVPLESLAMSALARLPIYPRMALARTDEQFEVAVEVPGVEASELEVALDEGVLTVHGARNEQREKRAKDYYRVERYRTAFDRSLRLPGPIEVEKAAATLKNGVLHVRLPRIKKGNGASHRVVIPVRTA